MTHRKKEPLLSHDSSDLRQCGQSESKTSSSSISRRTMVARAGYLAGMVGAHHLFGNGGTSAGSWLFSPWLDQTDDTRLAASSRALISSVAGYFTPDGFRHAITASPTGRLREVFFNPSVGKGISQLACVHGITHVDGFFSPDDGFQHVIVSDTAGNVSEIFFKQGDMHYGGTLANFSGILDIAAFYAEDDHSRIVIVATTDGAIHEIFYNPSIGVHITQPAIARFAGVVAIAAFYTPDDKTRHVIVATKDGNITEVFYGSAIGVHVSQPPLGNFAGVVDVGAFYAPDDKFRIVIVASANGDLHEIFYHPAKGVHGSPAPLINVSGLIAIAAFCSPDDKVRHIIVATAKGEVSEIFYGSSIGVHLSMPPLAGFGVSAPALEDVSPDPGNVDAQTSASLASVSSCGRVIGIVGTNNTLYARTEKSGIWKSKSGGPWISLANSPSDAALAGPQLAANPNDGNQLLAGGTSGAWHSIDGGATWSRVFDPKTNGCTSQQVAAVAFAQDGSLLVGFECGIVHRAPASTSFDFTATPGAIQAFAVSQSKVWARSDTALFVSSDNGRTWSAPFQMPSAVSFDRFTTSCVAGFDSFAYVPFSVAGAAPAGSCGQCGADVKLLVFNAARASWTTQNVVFNGCNACDGTGLGGRKFLKSFITSDASQPLAVGGRLQLFYGTGQEVYQALGLNADGTVTSWARPAVTFGSGAPPTNIHSDIWDINIDTAQGGNSVWIGCDGGVYRAVLANPYNLGGAAWSQSISGFHTHQIHTLTVLPVTPVHRSRLAYPTADNEAWCRSTSPIVMPLPPWQSVHAGGDVNYTVGDTANPDFVLLLRHRAAGTLKHFGGQNLGVILTNYKLKRLSSNPINDVVLNTIGPDGPTTIQFIQAPKGSGATTPDAVMMVDLPLTSWDANSGSNVPFDPNSPLGKSSNGSPVLIRNKRYVLEPNMNVGKGADWAVELGSFPNGTQGFYVTGSPKQPVYFAFGNDGTGLSLSKWSGSTWSKLAVSNLLSSLTFGPAFVNPYDQEVLYVITTAGIQKSSNGGASFAIDSQLTALVAGSNGAPMSVIAHMTFGYDDPAEVAAVTSVGGLFYCAGDGGWKDLTGFTPRPRAPFVAVGMDCEAIYVTTDGRGIFRVVDYQAS